MPSKVPSSSQCVSLSCATAHIFADTEPRNVLFIFLFFHHLPFSSLDKTIHSIEARFMCALFFSTHGFNWNGHITYRMKNMVCEKTRNSLEVKFYYLFVLYSFSSVLFALLMCSYLCVCVCVYLCCGDFELKIHFELKLNDVSNQCVSIFLIFVYKNSPYGR